MHFCITRHTNISNQPNGLDDVWTISEDIFQYQGRIHFLGSDLLSDKLGRRSVLSLPRIRAPSCKKNNTLHYSIERREVMKRQKVNRGDLHSLGANGILFPFTLTGTGFCLHLPGGARLQEFTALESFCSRPPFSFYTIGSSKMK